ncbi:MAG: hypothetical protein M3N98_13100 [Actinomycetota bacterium]|nr:hypothetical protein [Actinomycetota bacterium]
MRDPRATLGRWTPRVEPGARGRPARRAAKLLVFLGATSIAGVILMGAASAQTSPSPPATKATKASVSSGGQGRGVANEVLPAVFGLLGTAIGAGFTFVGVKYTSEAQQSIAAKQLKDADRVRREQYEREVRQGVLSGQQDLLRDMQDAIERMATAVAALARHRAANVQPNGIWTAPDPQELAIQVDETYMTAGKLSHRLPQDPLTGDKWERTLFKDVDEVVDELRRKVVDARNLTEQKVALAVFGPGVQHAQAHLGECVELINRMRLAELIDPPRYGSAISEVNLLRAHRGTDRATSRRRRDRGGSN